MSDLKAWYDNREELGRFLRHLADESRLNIHELIECVRSPWDWNDAYAEFDIQREMRRQTDRAADATRKELCTHH